MDMTFAFDLTAVPMGYHQFCADESINFQCNRWIQWMSPEAISELMAVSRKPGNYSEWIDAFLLLAEISRSKGRTLNAAYFDRGAEFYMEPSDPRKAHARQRIVSTLQDAFQVERLAVPYGGKVLPAYDLLPDPSVANGGGWLVFGGFDSYVEEWFPVLASVVGRGRRVIIFDGPGQGGALEEQHIPMIAEWEKPVAAVLDHFGLDDVTLVGASLGGELVIRAAAFERRAQRVVAFNAMDNFLETLLSQTAPGRAHIVAKLLTKLPAFAVEYVLHRLAARKPVLQWGMWQGMHVTGTSSPLSFLRMASTMRTGEISDRIHGDVLLLQGADDHYVPKAQLLRQTASLSNARSVTTRIFSKAEQASTHCQVGNIGLAINTILSWEDVLAERVI